MPDASGATAIGTNGHHHPSTTSKLAPRVPFQHASTSAPRPRDDSPSRNTHGWAEVGIGAAKVRGSPSLGVNGSGVGGGGAGGLGAGRGAGWPSTDRPMNGHAYNDDDSEDLPDMSKSYGKPPSSLLVSDGGNDDDGVKNRRSSSPLAYIKDGGNSSSHSLPSSSTHRPKTWTPSSSTSSSSSSSSGSAFLDMLVQPFRTLQASVIDSSSGSLLATLKFAALCSLWYMSSAISSNTGKAVFKVFKFPITLTLVQFAFIGFYCFLWTRPALGRATLREPSRAVITGVLPMAAFQVGGHVFSSVATSRIPVSTVHTIKALSPLFTVLSYRFLFSVSYTPATYVSLIPLTLGVMLACSFDISASNVFGLVCAFGSTLVFVSSNIYFKKIVPSTTGASTASAHAPGSSASTSSRLDKINLLFYSSSLAFAFMLPLFLYSDLLPILAESASRSISAPPRVKHVAYYLFLNGTSHFAQNILAFTILSSTSPVTYSIASLVKRIVVILMAIVWFHQTVHPVQAVGIALTFAGLYMYQNAKGEMEKVEKKVRKIESIREGSFLPSSRADEKLLEREEERMFPGSAGGGHHDGAFMGGVDVGGGGEYGGSSGHFQARIHHHGDVKQPSFLPPPPKSNRPPHP